MPLAQRQPRCGVSSVDLQHIGQPGFIAAGRMGLLAPVGVVFQDIGPIVDFFAFFVVYRSLLGNNRFRFNRIAIRSSPRFRRALASPLCRVAR